MVRSALSSIVLLGLAGCTHPLTPPASAARPEQVAPAPPPAGGVAAPTSVAVTASARPRFTAVSPATPPQPITTVPPRVEEGCLATRFVGLRGRGAAACPAAGPAKHGRWAVSSLFAATGARGASAVPPELRRYCVYDWQPSAKGAAPESASLASVGDVSNLAPDCRVVATLGSPATDVSWQAAHDAFLRRVDALPSLPLGSDAPAKVRVAVLDTSPDGSDAGWPLAGRSGHGFAVGSIVRELGCPGGEGQGACIAQVTTHLATPHVDETTVDYVHGGYFGTQAELAVALHRTLSDWVANRAREPRLVINLSLGWDPRYGGAAEAGKRAPDPAKMKGPVAAVHAMLVRAACLGALVIAASGNDAGGPNPQPGPMLPAGWETEEGPTRGQCRDVAESIDDSIPDGSASDYRPLLYSVGGLGANDAALHIGRIGGRPRLAAAATHGLAVRPGAPVSSPTDVLSGTSVAAAAVSGIAAAVWGYRPGWCARRVMGVVYASGTALRERADYHLEHPSSATPAAAPSADPDLTIRRVGLCDAVARACAPEAAPCGRSGNCSEQRPDPCKAVQLACKPVPAYADAGAHLTAEAFADLDHRAARVVDGSGVVYRLPPVEVCGLQEHFNTLPEYPPIVCPGRQYHRAPMMPWTLPQPGSDPCPTCVVTHKAAPSTVLASSDTTPVAPYTATLYVAIDSGYGQGLRAATLDLPGVGELSLPDLGVLTPGTVVIVDGIPLWSEPGVGGALSFAVVDASGQAVASTESVLLEQAR